MFAGVNTLYAALADNEDFSCLDFSNLVFCVSGGMATQEAVARRWKIVTGKPIVEGYGRSETSPIVAINRPDLDEFSGAIGYPVPSTQISIRLLDGSPAPFGERGELCVKGPQVMQGYWMKPEETAEVMTVDGFFRTGDVAMMLPDGQIKIVDPVSNHVLVSGFRVYPNEVEDVLARHPKVKEVEVIGVPDSRSGEAPLAFIVPRDPSLTAQELDKFARENLAGYKAPRTYEFRGTLPGAAYRGTKIDPGVFAIIAIAMELEELVDEARVTRLAQTDLRLRIEKILDGDRELDAKSTKEKILSVFRAVLQTAPMGPAFRAMCAQLSIDNGDEDMNFAGAVVFIEVGGGDIAPEVLGALATADMENPGPLEYLLKRGV